MTRREHLLEPGALPSFWVSYGGKWGGGGGKGQGGGGLGPVGFVAMWVEG